MKSPQTLRRPENWQDFESLCMKLWCGIWSCPEIKKNGRSGQKQHGVDIYGIPKGEDKYSGIQCKGKDEYTHKQITKNEINAEIKKAKLFRPTLRKLYFATTAIKDANIEEYVRITNESHIKAGLFEVHLYFWPEIVDLIDENKVAHDWYMSLTGFKNNQSIKVSFSPDVSEIRLSPKFRQSTIHYKLKAPQEEKLSLGPVVDSLAHINKSTPLTIRVEPSFVKKTNYSFGSFKLVIHNTGIEPLRNYKLKAQIEEQNCQLSISNQIGNSYDLSGLSFGVSDTHVDNITKSILFKPINNSILVGDDTISSETIYLKPYPKNHEIVLRWKLISNRFKEEGRLNIIVEPNIENDESTVYVKSSKYIRTKKNAIEDLIE